MGRVLVIGDPKAPLLSLPMAEVAWSVTYESSRKVTEKAADGDDDATAVDGGREVRKITLKLAWPDRKDARERGAAIIKVIDPSNKVVGSPPGSPPLWSDAEEDGSMDYGALKNVRRVVIKQAKGPDADPATGVVKYELSIDSNSPQTKGVAKTVEKATYVLQGGGQQVQGPATPTNTRFGRATNPAVKP